MRVVYFCDVCGRRMAELSIPVVDEVTLGFDALTPEERADIIKFDAVHEVITVKSLCDDCVKGLDEVVVPRFVH